MKTSFSQTRSLSVAQAPRGFTLIELLTVIAIIGILAAILIPTVATVRQKARAADCVSRLRQIGVAVRLFADEHKGMAPPYRGELSNPADPGSFRVLWTEYIFPYFNSKQAPGSARLPAPLASGEDFSKDSRFNYMCPGSPVPVAWRAWGNYATHPNIMKKSNGAPNYRLANVARPSQVVMIADGSVTLKGGLVSSSPYGSVSENLDTGYFEKTYDPAADSGKQLDEPLDTDNPNVDGEGQVGWFRYRHNNNVNCLYVDGHVKANPMGTLTFGNVIDTR